MTKREYMTDAKDNNARRQLLKQLENFFEIPLIVLGFIWLALLVVELVYKGNAVLEKLGLFIWGIFIIDFIVKFLLAETKIKFLRANLLTILSLVVPAFRIFKLFRVLRLFRFSRSIRLVKIIGTLNRSMRTLAATMQRRAFGYVMMLSFIVLLVGAAGMYTFEKDVAGGLDSYASALWWTGMILTTMGSEYWPITPEGRILCVILALYAFAVFGYVTATIATFFIGRDAENNTIDTTSTAQLKALQQEIKDLKALLTKNANP